ncbi:MAG: hypothetical protein RLZZ15_1056, partial [Verrucomicrobiota bacterium]
MPWYLYLAFKQLFPGGRFPFFTLMSMLGVTLGVAVLVVTTGVMDGFGNQIKKMTVDTQGDVQVSGENAFANVAEIENLVAGVPGVIAATPFARGVVLLEHGGRKPAYPGIEGIDINRVRGVVPLDRYIHGGSIDQLDDDSIILSVQLAKSLGARLGDKVEVYSPLIIEKLKRDEIFLPRELRVVALFEFGHQALDSSLVLTTLRTMQDLYGLQGAVHGLNLKIAPGADADAVAARLNAVLPRAAQLRARSWIELNREFLFII